VPVAVVIASATGGAAVALAAAPAGLARFLRIPLVCSAALMRSVAALATVAAGFLGIPFVGMGRLMRCASAPAGDIPLQFGIHRCETSAAALVATPACFGAALARFLA